MGPILDPVGHAKVSPPPEVSPNSFPEVNPITLLSFKDIIILMKFV